MKEVPTQIASSALQMVDGVQQVITETERTIETTVAPVRQNIVKRYPTAFLLAVTFGATLTFFSIERLLLASPFFVAHPWVSLLIGLSVLWITRTIYKKLG